MFAAPSCKKEAPLGVKEILGWAEGAGYEWVEGPDEIRTEQAFFDYINGAAQPIIDLGWKRSLYGVLDKGESRLRLTIHEMTDSKAAVSLLEQSSFSDTEPIDLADRAINWDRGEFSRGILFQKQSFVCELTFQKGGNKDLLIGLASSLEALAE